MAFQGWYGRAGRTAAALMVCGTVAGCGAGGTPGFEASHDSAYSVGSLSSLGRKLGNLVAFDQLFPTSAPLPQSDVAVDCPTVEVQDGTASARFYSGAGQTNSDVRYGFALGDVARECSKVGNQLQLKVGIEGRVLVGPAGAPGTFTIPVRIAVRNDVLQKPVSSQVARVSATVSPDGTQADFTYVTEPFSVPFVAHPDEDYTILVGFDTNAKSAEAGTAPKRRKPRS